MLHFTFYTLHYTSFSLLIHLLISLLINSHMNLSSNEKLFSPAYSLMPQIDATNTRIYNLNSGPRITRFSTVETKKRKNFE